MVGVGQTLKPFDILVPAIGPRDVLARVRARRAFAIPTRVAARANRRCARCPWRWGARWPASWALAEIIGSNDHLLQELPRLVELARRRVLDTLRVVTRAIPLDADAVNQTLDVERFDGGARTVIVP